MQSPLRLLLILVLAACVPTRAGADEGKEEKAAQKWNPASSYLRGYQMMEEGAKLLEAQDYSAAYYKLKDSQELFDSIFHSDPSWNAELVQYRRTKVRELREEARAEEASRRKLKATKEGKELLTPFPKDPSAPKASKEDKATAPGKSGPEPTAAELKEQVRKLQQQQLEMARQIEEKDAQLLKANAALRTAQLEQTKLLEKLEREKK